MSDQNNMEDSPHSGTSDIDQGHYEHESGHEEYAAESGAHSESENVPEGAEAHYANVHNTPREATDPFAPGDTPIALLEFHSPTRGLVNMPATASAENIIWLIGSLVLASLAAMALFPLNKVVSLNGRLISVEQPLLIEPFDTAIVRTLNAHIGDYVHKGEVLATLDPTMTASTLNNLTTQASSYRAEIARLKAEAQGEPYHVDLNTPASVQQGETYLKRRSDYLAHLQDFDHRIAALQNDLQTARANAAMYASKVKVVSAVLGMRQREQKEQVGSRLATLGAQDAVMDAERSLIAAQQSAHGAKEKITALQASRSSYIEGWKAAVYTALVQAERKYAEINSNYQKARLQQGLIQLRAPADGIVLTIGKTSVGAIAQAGTPVMTLMPTGTGLEMEGLLPAQDGGYIKVGDRALVKFATFPYDQYGGGIGQVRMISADTFMPGQLVSDNIRAGLDPSSLGGGKGGALFYRVRLKILRYTLHGTPSFFHPAPGVPVSADIDVGKRTIMQYLFSQTLPTLKSGMREPS